ncbi:MAG: Ubiquitin-protein ligase [bacterium]|nr:MAG: Ubiquitin-protein ligase [bacterium]
MATPEDVRRARLEADYEEMKSIQGNVISWQAYGTPPHEYIVSFNIRSYINTSLTRDEHRIRIILSPSHPFEKPVVMMHEMVPIFHPHVWPDGKVCIGGWDYREGLGSFVVKLARLFQYDPDLVDPYSIANYNAADWYYANPTLFPSDRQILPVPGREPSSSQTFQVKKVIDSPSGTANPNQPPQPPPPPRRTFLIRK